MPLDGRHQEALVLPADGVRAPTSIRTLIALGQANTNQTVTACGNTVNPPGPIVNPLLDPLLDAVSSRRTRVSPAWGVDRQETRLYVDALETGAYGKTDLVTLKEAGPGHQDGERFLTVSHVQKQVRLGAKKNESSTWMSYGLDGVSMPGERE